MSQALKPLEGPSPTEDKQTEMKRKLEEKRNMLKQSMAKRGVGEESKSPAQVNETLKPPGSSATANK